MYDQDIKQKDMPPSYRKLKTMVRKSLDQKTRTRNVEARNERTVAGAPEILKMVRGHGTMKRTLFQRMKVRVGLLLHLKKELLKES